MSTPRRIRSNTPRPGDVPAAGARVVAPELLDPRGPDPWQVRLLAGPQGGTNHTDRRMFAPRGADPASAHVRLHELMHARITPPGMLRDGFEQGRTLDALQACEDARIGETGHNTPGLGLLAQSAASEEEVQRTLAAIITAAQGAAGMPPALGAGMAARAWHGAACLAVCLWRTDRWPGAWLQLRGACPSHVIGAVSSALGEINGGKHGDAAATIRAAAHLDAILTPPPTQAGRSDGTDWPEGEREDIPEGEDAASWDAAAERVRVYPAPLAMRLHHSSRARRRTSDLGRLSHPSDVLRMEAGRPFSRTRKVQGAVILLDSSGSMHYSHEDLAAIVQAAPGALVAIHAENGAGEGTLAVVGRGGRCTNPSDLANVRELVGGGNRNDGGCLQLLARMADRERIPGPRFWVTDEGFGDYDGNIGAGNVVAACRRLAARHGFEIVATETDVFA